MAWANDKVSMFKSNVAGKLFRVCCAIAMTSACTGFSAIAQTPSADLSFEVATVKPVVMDATHPLTLSISGRTFLRAALRTGP